MDAYTLVVMAIASATGGLFYWAIRQRRPAPVRVKARIRRR
jgi:hypothetical protein